MQVDYKLKIGQDEFLLKLDVESPTDFFKKVSFYSGLPKFGPAGETDLKVTHRTTKEGYNYFSLVSETAGMEFKFGQSKEEPGTLFGKGWETIYKGDNQESVAPVQVQAQRIPTPIANPSPIPPTSQHTGIPVPTQAPPQTSQAANNVLSRFGLKQ